MSVKLYAPAGITVEVIARDPVDTGGGGAAGGTGGSGSGGGTPPPPPMTRPTVNMVPLDDLTAVVAIVPAYQGVAEYDRLINHVEIKPGVTQSVFEFKRSNIPGGGSHAVPLAYPRYGLLVAPMNDDGTLGPAVDRAIACTINANYKWDGTLTVKWGPEDGRYALVQMCAYDAAGNLVTSPTERFAPFFVALNRNGLGKDFPFYVVQNGSFDWTHPNTANYNAARHISPAFMWTAIPVAWLADPPTFPLTPHVAQMPAVRVPINPLAADATFNTQIAAAAKELTRINISPSVDADAMNPLWPRRARSGMWTIGAVHGYFWSDLVTQEFPPFDELDGARAPNLLKFVLHAWISKRPGEIARKGYGATKLRWFKWQPNGTIETLCGLRNKGNAARYRTQHSGSNPYDESPTIADYEIVNADKWDPNVPMAERYPKESWSSGFRPSSVALDQSVPPISDPPGSTPEQPHIDVGGIGPQAMIGDGHGFWLRQDFEPDAHQTRAIRRLRPANDPWGGAVWKRNGNWVGVERGANRIVELDWDGNLVRVVLEDQAASRFGVINPADRTFGFVGVTTADVTSGRAAFAVRSGSKCCAPEGLSITDDDWCYVGSYAMGGFFSFHMDDPLGTWRWGMCVDMDWLRQSHFVAVAAADATLGYPKDTVLCTTFGIENNGLPAMWMMKPGVTAFGEPATHTRKANNFHAFAYDQANGPGGASYGAVYPTAVDASMGTITFGAASGGIMLLERADATDVAYDPQALIRGAHEWRLRGYDLIWSREGFAPHKLPLPWGENPDMDIWLKSKGHTP